MTRPTTPQPVRITAPRTPEPPPPYHFPLVASVAPVVVSLGMWALTQSPYALMFAALGPVIALASLADSRLQARRTKRRESKRFAIELALARDEISTAHDVERVERDELTPAGSTIARRSGSDRQRWRDPTALIVPVLLGRGTVASSVIVDGVELSRLPSEPESSREALVEYAAELTDAPVVVDSALGIALVGSGSTAAALARSIAVQLAWALSPLTSWWRAVGDVGEWAWLESLPHPGSVDDSSHPRGVTQLSFGRVGDEAPAATLTIAATESAISTAAHVVVRAEAGRAAIIAHPDRAARVELRPDFVTAEHAAAWATAARCEAERQGIVRTESAVPDSVRFEVLRAANVPRTSGLGCAPVVGASGFVRIDLAEHGPHAIVGGATGSGKSEFLISWLLAMAASHSPAEVNFMLIDFKGGSTFASLSGLPHTVGILTDLDADLADRAFESLRAELRYRERALLDLGARDIDAAGRLPRLVIVVDEFAAMLADYPDLHGLFADIASRGRSLGVHLVLCTQRPAAVARDAVLANTDLRISLRVNNRQDSTAVIGSDAAALVSRGLPGRAFISIAGGEPAVVQAALAGPDDAHTVTSLWPGPWRPRRPWCEPLPNVVPIGQLPRAAFGLLDLPGEQRQEAVGYSPSEHGHLLILGANGSGRSTAVRALAATAEPMWIPATVEGSWDALGRLLDPVMTERVALFDDLDAVLGRFGDEHRAAMVDRLVRVAREGPARGVWLVFAAQHVSGELQPLASLIGTRLLLRQSSKQDLLLAGGDSAGFRADAPPGRGDWRGHVVQVASGAPAGTPSRPPIPPLRTDRPLAVISTRPRRTASQLRNLGMAVTELASGDEPVSTTISSRNQTTAVVGDPDEWQSRWGALGAARATSDLLFVGCSVTEFRTLTRSRELPPPLATEGACWLLDSHGAVSRVLLLPTD